METSRLFPYYSAVNDLNPVRCDSLLLAAFSLVFSSAAWGIYSGANSVDLIDLFASGKWLA